MVIALASEATSRLSSSICPSTCSNRRLALTTAAPIAHHTVTTVAHACGFSNLGHFSARYRRRFGELPSETLRQARQ